MGRKRKNYDYKSINNGSQTHTHTQQKQKQKPHRKIMNKMNEQFAPMLQQIVSSFVVCKK